MFKKIVLGFVKIVNIGFSIVSIGFMKMRGNSRWVFFESRSKFSNGGAK